MSEKNRGGPSRRLRFESEEPALTSGQLGPKLPPHPKNRRKLAQAPADTKTPPLSERPDASPPVEDAPSTSGQVGPKSEPGGKLRQDSEQARPSDRLRHGEEPPPTGEDAADGGAARSGNPKDKKAAREDKRTEKSKYRAEKSGDKLNNAREKLANQKPPKKPGPVKTAGRAAGYQAWRYAHGKIHQVEHENTGIEAAHKTELAGEKVLRVGTRFIKRRIRTRPARQVRKWENRDMKAKADYAFRQMAQEHPELSKNALTRFWQKRRMKKQYQKQAREAAKTTKRAAQKAAVTAEKIAGAVWGFIKKNPKVFLLLAAAFLIVVLLQSCMAAVMSIGNGALGAVAGTSYLAEDADIDRAELAYTEWETDLQLEINNAERTHPGYDEYRYNVADISHNPYELMAYLTAVYDDFTFAGVQGALRQIFDGQYTLTFTEEIEVRYRTETRTDTWTDEDGNEHSDTYEVEVPYNYYILHIDLAARSFSDVVFSRMNAEQLERYNVYMITKGNRQYLQSPFGETNWLSYVSSYYGYRVHPISGAKDYHKGADIAMPQGTEILAGQDGTVTFAGDNGGYGLVVVLDNGEGLVSKYAHCSALLVSAGQTVKAGEPIARVGSTGNSTGAHLHLEIIKDGTYLNPLYFAVTNDYAHSGAGTQGPEYGDPGAAMGDGTYAALIAEAEKHLGKPYVFGASGPDSFDCSGFVCYALNQSGVSGMGRTNAQGLYNRCTPVAPDEARPGDLIFFTGTYSTPNACSHVGIYVGGGQMIHAGKPVQYSSVNTRYWQSHFYSYGRLN